MDCTITTTKQVRAAAMALVELLFAASISIVALTVLGSFVFFSGRSFVSIANFVDLDNSSRSALDKMTSEIRQANRLTGYSSTNLIFEMVDPQTGATNALSYNYNSGAGTLNRIYCNQTTTLLKEISPNSLKFALYQRNPIGGSIDQYPTTDATVCKVVQISWLCSRKILGKSANTQSVQTAKIVIRKE